MDPILNLFNKDRLKAVAALLVHLVGIIAAVVAYAQLKGSAATYVSAGLAGAGALANYITVYLTKNAPRTP